MKRIVSKVKNIILGLLLIQPKDLRYPKATLSTKDRNTTALLIPTEKSSWDFISPKHLTTNEEIVIEDIKMERRLHTRHRARTPIFIHHGGQLPKVTAVNLSARGVAVKSETVLGMRVGTVCELAFVINLGMVSKIHRRQARVVFVKNGITGFMMESYAERKSA